LSVAVAVLPEGVAEEASVGVVVIGVAVEEAVAEVSNLWFPF